MEKENLLHVCTEKPSESRDNSLDVVLVSEKDAEVELDDEDGWADNQWLSEIFNSGRYFNVQYGFDLDKFSTLVENSNILHHEYEAYRRDDLTPIESRQKLREHPMNHKVICSYENEQGELRTMFWGSISFTAYKKCEWYPAFKLNISYCDSDVSIDDNISFETSTDFCKFLKGLLDCIVCVDQDDVVKMMTYLSKEIDRYAHANRILAKVITK